MAFPRIAGLRCLELGSRGSQLQRELNALVLSGVKVATAGLLADYAEEGEPVETVGEEQYLLDTEGQPIARVRYTRVQVVPFAEVTWEFAQAEGEGFTDLEDWRTAHRRYWQRESGVEVSDDDPVVCLWLEVLEILDEGGPEAGPRWALRPLVVEDAEAAAGLSRRARFDAIPGYPDLHTPAEDVAFYRQQIADAQGRGCVDDAGTVLGFVLWRGPLIEHLYVDVARQRAGIGSALLRCALDGIGERPVRLWTFEANERARAFYARHGFVVVDATDGSGNEEGLPDLLLQLD